MNDIFGSITGDTTLSADSPALDNIGDGTGSLLLANPGTGNTPSTTSTTSSSGGFLSGLLGVITPLSGDASSVLNAVKGTTATTSTAAAATTSSNVIMWVVLGGIGLIAVLFLAGRK